MITSNTPFTRRFRLVLAAIIIAALSIGSVQLASAQPQRAGKAHKLKVRMINPFYQGIAVKPSKITYFNWQKQQRLTLSGLAWQSWGGSRAMAVGQNNDGDQVDVALSARRKCGMPKFRFYTRMVVSGESSPLQCKVQVLSATDIGEAAEDVYSLPKLNARYDISIPPQSATITHAVWRGFGKSTIKGRGVASAWWSLYDFRWVPALMIQSRPGYCAQYGAIVYRKVQLISYGNGIEEGSMPIKRAARLLRKQIGQGAKHSLRYNYTEWCKRKKYPMENWAPWK